MYNYIKGILIFLLFYCANAELRGSNKENDTIKNYIPFFQVKSAGGTVLPTSPIVDGNKSVGWFNAASIRFGYQSTGHRWEDRIYKMPNVGIGVHLTDFYRHKDIGRPITLYLFYGAQWKRFSSKLSLNYELNLGYSIDWKPYNPLTNPQNGAIGAKWAVFVAFEPHIVWQINPYFDLLFGVMLSHYSNGGTRKPNNGLNMISPTISLRYNLQRVNYSYALQEKIPYFKPRINQDVSFNVALRQLMVDIPDDKGDKVPLDHNFEVFGLNYNCYYVPNYNYRYGASVHLVYDASSNADIQVAKNGMCEVNKAKFKRRLSLGIAAYGELATEYFSIFANVGYNVVHNQIEQSRFYQILGVKCYLNDTVYGTVGVNVSKFTSAKYLFLSLGYTFR